MAILIDASVDLKGNITVDQSYLRLEYKVNQFGDKIECPIYAYYNKSSYEEDKSYEYVQQGLNRLSPKDIPKVLWFDYDKDADGTDVLQITHEKTREFLIDPSKGWFLPADVSIVDIDPSVG